MDTITLGPARMGDAPQIAAMSRTLIEDGLPWSWTPRRVAAHMRQRENLVVTARCNREMVGFAMAHFGNENVRLTLLGVSDLHQRRGVDEGVGACVEVVAGFDDRHAVRQIA